MSGSNHRVAERAARLLLERAFPGRRCLNTIITGWGARAAVKVWKRRQIVPGQWKATDARWILEQLTPNLGRAKRYLLFVAIRRIARRLGHWPDWEPHLRGPWTQPPDESRAVRDE